MKETRVIGLLGRPCIFLCFKWLLYYNKYDFHVLFWYQKLNSLVRCLTCSLFILDSDTSNIAIGFCLLTVNGMPSVRPINFSWVIDGLLSGCAFPSHGQHFQFLAEAGVRHLVTLTDFTPPLHLLPKGRLKFFVVLYSCVIYYFMHLRHLIGSETCHIYSVSSLRQWNLNKLCGRPPQYAPPPASWPFDLESGVRVTCEVGYLCANFSLPRSLCSRLRPDILDRQTSERHLTCIVA